VNANQVCGSVPQEALPHAAMVLDFPLVKSIAVQLMQIHRQHEWLFSGMPFILEHLSQHQARIAGLGRRSKLQRNLAAGVR
jgi:hypothetical protein